MGKGRNMLRDIFVLFNIFEPANVHSLNFLNLRMSTSTSSSRQSAATTLRWKIQENFFLFFLLTGRGECRGKVYKLSPEINILFWNTSLVAWSDIICKVLEVKQLDHVGIFVFSPRSKVDQNPERFGPSKVQVFFHLFDKMTKIWTR